MKFQDLLPKCVLSFAKLSLEVEIIVGHLQVAVPQLQLRHIPKMSVGWLVGWLITKSYDTSTLTIFLIFCMMLALDKLCDMTEPDFPKKLLSRQKIRKCGQNDGFWPFFQV